MVTRVVQYLSQIPAEVEYVAKAGCIIVMNEVFVRTVEYADEYLPHRIPEKAEHSYGYSFGLSWFVFVIFILAGCIFLFMSHKRKPEMADTVDQLAEEDEPMQLGR